MKKKTLKEMRKEMDLTQIEIAKKIGVSYGAYKIWEYGGGKPSIENMRKVCKLFKIDESYFDDVF